MRAGVSTASSAPLTALQLWVVMYGLLRGRRYDMTWPPRDVVDTAMILALAHIEPT